MKNVKYTADSKFIVVYDAENYQNSGRFDKDIAKIKQCSSFCLTWYVGIMFPFLQFTVGQLAPNQSGCFVY